MLLVKLLFCLTILTAFLSVADKDRRDKFKGFKLRKWQLSIFKTTLKLLLRGNNSERVKTMNKQVDYLLPALNTFVAVAGLDPIDIPGFDASFKWTAFSGGIVLKDGFLHGVSTLERHSDVIVKYTEPNLKITIPLGFSNLTFAYTYDVKFMKLGPSGNATGGSQGNKVTVHLHLNTRTLKAALDKFHLETLGSISFILAGNGMTDWIINLILPVVMPLLKPILKLVIKGYIVDEFESILELYNDAVCAEQKDC